MLDESIHPSCACNLFWSDRGVVGVETFYHPLKRIWHDQDGAETTVLTGEWTTSGRSDRYHKQRRPLVSIVRWLLGCITWLSPSTPDCRWLLSDWLSDISRAIHLFSVYWISLSVSDV